MCAREQKSAVEKYLHLEYAQDDGTPKATDIYIGKYYKFTYSSGTDIEIRFGLVKAINDISLKVSFFNVYMDNIVFVKDNVHNCSRPLGGDPYYVTQVEADVLYANILDVDPYIEESQPMEVTKVAILGISSEMIQSVVIRLRLYDDATGHCEVAGATIVDMKVGGRYKVGYIDHSDHTNYEIEGELKAIQVLQNDGAETPNHGFVRPECCDQVGMGNIPYDSKHFMNLPKYNCDNVIFTFDTSTVSNASFETVKLMDIRMISELKEEPADDGEGPADDGAQENNHPPCWNSTNCFGCNAAKKDCVQYPACEPKPIKIGKYTVGMDCGGSDPSLSCYCIIDTETNTVVRSLNTVDLLKSFINTNLEKEGESE